MKTPSIARLKPTTAVWIAASVGGALLLLVANAHLVYVAIVSQPDCIDHLREGEGAAGKQFRAAQSSCTPQQR